MIIEARKLRKYFTIAKGKVVHAVDDVTVGINTNEVLGLVGESGSGKTTLLKMLNGLTNAHI